MKRFFANRRHSSVSQASKAERANARAGHRQELLRQKWHQRREARLASYREALPRLFRFGFGIALLQMLWDLGLRLKGSLGVGFKSEAPIPSAFRAGPRRLQAQLLTSRQLLAGDITYEANDTAVAEELGGILPNNGQYELSITSNPTDFTVEYDLTGDAQFGSDYTASFDGSPLASASGTLTISAGVTNAIIDIDVIDDSLWDGDTDEVVDLTLSNNSAGTLAVGPAGTQMDIVDNEVAPTLTIAPGVAGTEGGGNGTFVITMSGASDENTDVSLTYDGTAVEGGGADFTAPAVATIVAGSFSTTATVSVNDDDLVEETESVEAEITGAVSDPTGDTLPVGSPSTATISINDDDSATISIAATMPAASEPGTNGEFTFTMTGAAEGAAGPTVIQYSTVTTPGSAIEGTDYTTGNIDEVESNEIDPANDLFGPQAISGAQGLGGFSLQPNGAIANATTRPHVSITSTPATNDGSVDFYAFYTGTGGTVVLDIDGVTGGAFDNRLRLFDANGNQVAFANAGGNGETTLSTTVPAGLYYAGVYGGNTLTSGVAGSKGYTLHVSADGADGYAVIGAGQTSFTLPIDVIDDNILEGSEAVEIVLDNSVVLGDPQITIPGNAAARTDTVTIADDDSPATATVSDTSAGAPLEGFQNGEFTIELDKPVATAVEIPYTISGTAFGPDDAPLADAWQVLDHNLASGTVTFNPGVTEITLAVDLVDTSLIEDDETVTITLGTPSASGLTVNGAGNSDTLTIGDDDSGFLHVDATTSTVVEDSAGTGVFTFFINEPPATDTTTPVAADRDIVITYIVEASSTATSGTDYTPLTLTATIPAGSPSVDVLVDPTPDTDIEGDETVTVTVTGVLTPTDSNISVGTGSPTDTVTILDDDSLQVEVTGSNDGTEGTTDGEFTFNLVGASVTTAPVVVEYEVSGGTAVEGTDFAPVVGTVTIPTGMSSETINIDATGIYDDMVVEGTETIEITITDVTGGGSPMAVTVGSQDSDTINLFDDETGDVAVGNPNNLAEADMDGSFEITLDGVSTTPTVVTYVISFPNAGMGPDTEAIPGVDYDVDSSASHISPLSISGTTATGTVTFAPNTTSVIVPLEVKNDGTSEILEDIDISLGSIVSGLSLYDINNIPGNNDTTVTVYSDQIVRVDATVPAANEPGTDGEFTFYLETPGIGATTSDQNVVIEYTVATGAGQATPGDDYTTLSGTATITPGNSSVTVPVEVLDDSTLENPETVTVTIDSISGESDIDVTTASGDDTATVTINDDDAAYITVEATQDGMDNPSGPDMDGQFTVTISAPSDEPVVVTYDVLGSSTATPSPGGAIPNQADYTALSGSVTIPAGQTTATIDVSVLSDNVVEPDETVTINLTGATAGALPVFLGAIGSISGFGTTSVFYQEGFLGYTGQADTFVDQLNPFTPFGSETFAAIFGGFSAGEEAQGLMRFDDLFGTGPLQIPAGSIISDATLGLSVGPGGSFGDSLIDVFEMAAAWDEATLTWDNANLSNGMPGIQGAEVGSPVATAVSLFATMPTFSTVDVTGSVLSWQGGATNNGWLFQATTPDGGGGGLVATSEAFTPSYLQVNLDMSATVVIQDKDTSVVNVGAQIPVDEDVVNPNSPQTGIEVTLSAPSATTTVVTYDVLPSSTASPSDLDTPLSGTVTFAPGQTSAYITINPFDDALVEGDETIDIELTGVISGDPSTSLGSTLTGTGTILEDDFALISVAGTTDGDENGVGGPDNPPDLDPIDGVFTITTTTAVNVDTVIPYTVGGTASSGMDFTALSGSVTLPANFLSTTITVDVIDDLINESPNETVTIMLGAPTSGILANTLVTGPNASINIADDEQPLEVSIEATEDGIEGVQDGEFTFELNFPSDQPTTIVYRLNTAATDPATPALNDANPDFDQTALIENPSSPSSTTGTIVIPANQTTYTVPVDVFQDFDTEGDENVEVEIVSVSNGNGAGIGTAIDTVVIEDETYEVSVAKTDSPAAEPGPPVGNDGQFTVSITNPLPEDVIVTYTIGGDAIPDDGTPNSPAPNQFDYDELSGTVTILAGQTTAVIDVEVIDDLVVEGDETVTVTLDSAVLAAALPAPLGTPSIGVDTTTATEVISDDDSALLSISATSQDEDEVYSVPRTEGLFTVSQSLPASVDTVFTYTVEPSSTADDPADYSLAPTTLTGTITAGATSTTIAVNPVDDNTVEDDETVVIKLDTILSSDPDVTIDTGSDEATSTIVDDDSAVVSVLGVSNGFEPGTNDGIFRFFLSQPSDAPTIVEYTIGGDATPSGSAVAPQPADYTTLSGTVTIPAGATSYDLGVDVLDDLVIEDLETVTINMTSVTADAANPGNYDLTLNATTTASVTIGDNDSGSVVIEAGSDAAEPSTDGNFVIKLTDGMGNPRVSDEPTVVSYSVGGTAAATGPGADHGLGASGSVTIPAFASQVTLTVPVNDDNVQEGNESVVVTLGSVTSGHPTISAGGSASIDIIDDDAPVFTITSDTVTEGDPGDNVEAELTVSLDKPFAVPTSWTINLEDLADTAYAASAFDVSGMSYVINIAAGALTPTGLGSASNPIVVQILEDNVVEDDEVVTAYVDSTTAPAPYSTIDGVVTILNDDEAVFTVSSPGLDPEGDDSNFGPFANVPFTVTSSNPIDVPVDIKVSFADGTAVGGDFDSFLPPPGTAPGVPTTIGGLDYDNPDQTLTFNAGDVSESLNVRVNQDQIVEGGVGTNPAVYGGETFTASLSDETGSRLTDTSDTETATITDDDTAEVNITSATVDGGVPVASEPSTDGKFIVTLTDGMGNPRVSSSDTVVTYSVSGTADAGVDYNTLTGTVTITAGTSSEEINVEVLNNPILEDDETVIVTLTGFDSRDPQVSLGGDDEATVQIDDDDDALVSISASIPNAAETDPAGNANGEFTVTLSEVSDVDTVVYYTVTDFTPGDSTDDATPGTDYATLLGTVTIPAMQTTATIEVDVFADSDDEPDENVDVQLTGFGSPTNTDIDIDPANDKATVVIGDSDGNIKIVALFNDDGTEPGPPTGDDGSFLIQLQDENGTPINVPAGTTVQVSFNLGGTATVNDDYTTTSGFNVSINGPNNSAPVPIDVSDDFLIEGTETVTMDLVTFNVFGSGANGSGTGFAVPPTGTTGMLMLDPSVPTVQIFDNDVPALKVTAIRTGSSGWDPAFKSLIDPTESAGYEIPTGSVAQVSPIGWGTMDQLIVDFSEPVSSATPADFDIVAETSGNPIAISSVMLNPAKTRATITLNGNLDADRYSLIVKDSIVGDAFGQALDGEGFVNQVEILADAGDGNDGGSLEFDFAVSPGNASFIATPSDNLGTVNLLDVSFVAARFNTVLGGPGNYAAEADMDGDGDVDLLDVSFAAARFNNELAPPSSPFAASVDALFAADDEDTLSGSDDINDTIDTLSEQS
ncbi:Calx-beta domain-containing protein [Crateriforma spongiae]|uniref:Calx-beta domain-containing protein n=1 Tax=Crateriforma spongiae TaxID=2724528 RepID=UPI0039B08611